MVGYSLPAGPRSGGRIVLAGVLMGMLCLGVVLLRGSLGGNVVRRFAFTHRFRGSHKGRCVVRFLRTTGDGRAAFNRYGKVP